MKKVRRNGRGAVAQSLLTLALFFLCVCCFLNALGTVKKASRREEEKRIEDVIKKSVISYYSTEGVYPATLEHVERQYGLILDKEHYVVFYEIFADNVMPEITVVSKSK